MCAAARFCLIAIVVASCRGDTPRAPAITIAIAYDGAAPGQVEQAVAVPIEHALAPLSELRSIKSRCEAGRATITVELAGDRDASRAKILGALSRIQRELPDGVTPPAISGPSGPPSLVVEVTGSQPPVELSELARVQIFPRLARIPGVGAVEILDDTRRAIVVWPDLQRLGAAGITLDELDALIPTRDTTDPARLGQLVVAERNGAQIRLVDLAHIESTVEPRGAGSPRVAISLQPAADASATLAVVRNQLAELRAIVPPGVSLNESNAPPAKRPPLSVVLHGPDLDVLDELAGKVQGELRALGGIEVVRDPPLGEPARELVVDRNRAAELGVPSSALATTLRILDAGSRRGEITLRVLETAERMTAQVRSTRGELVPISAIVSEKQTVQRTITRIDMQRVVTLSVDAIGPGLVAARKRLAALTRELPAGYRATYPR